MHRGFFSGELQVTSRSRSRHSPNEGSRNRRSPNRGTLIRIRRQQGLRQRANPIRRPSLDASLRRASPSLRRTCLDASPIWGHTSPRDASPNRLRASPSRVRASLRRASRLRAIRRHTSGPA